MRQKSWHLDPELPTYGGGKKDAAHRRMRYNHGEEDTPREREERLPCAPSNALQPRGRRYTPRARGAPALRTVANTVVNVGDGVQGRARSACPTRRRPARASRGEALYDTTRAVPRGILAPRARGAALCAVDYAAHRVGRHCTIAGAPHHGASTPREHAERLPRAPYPRPIPRSPLLGTVYSSSRGM